MKELSGDKIQMFLTYDMETHKREAKKEEGDKKIERFFNRDQNFSITWYPSVKEYYNAYVQGQIENIKKITESKERPAEEKVRSLMQNPCFIIAHELYDALPIHQFEFGADQKWHERMIVLDAKEKCGVKLSIEHEYRENIEKVLKPEKLFGKT